MRDRQQPSFGQLLLRERTAPDSEEQLHIYETSLLAELFSRNGRAARIQSATPPGYHYEIVDSLSAACSPTGGPVLEIAAHPGDGPDFFYATYLQIAEHTKQQRKLHEILLTDGEGGVDGWSPERTRRARIEEAYAGAAVIGSQLHFLSYPDGSLSSLAPGKKMQLVTRLVEKIESIQPELLVIHPPKNDHPDHAYSFLLTLAALKLSGQQTESPLPTLLIHDVEFGLQQQSIWPHEEGNPDISDYPMHSPDYIVDISTTRQIAQYALHQHQTQMYDPVTTRPKLYLDLVDKLARVRGLQIRAEGATDVPYGQGFSQVIIPGVTSEQNLLPLLLPQGSVYRRVRKKPRSYDRMAGRMPEMFPR